MKIKIFNKSSLNNRHFFQLENLKTILYQLSPFSLVSSTVPSWTWRPVLPEVERSLHPSRAGWRLVWPLDACGRRLLVSGRIPRLRGRTLWRKCPSVLASDTRNGLDVPAVVTTHPKHNHAVTGNNYSATSLAAAEVTALWPHCKRWNACTQTCKKSLKLVSKSKFLW